MEYDYPYFTVEKTEMQPEDAIAQFTHPAVDGTRMETQVSQSPHIVTCALDSGLEGSEAAQIHFHAFLLLLFSECVIGLYHVPGQHTYKPAVPVMTIVWKA